MNQSNSNSSIKFSKRNIIGIRGQGRTIQGSGSLPLFFVQPFIFFGRYVRGFDFFRSMKKRDLVNFLALQCTSLGDLNLEPALASRTNYCLPIRLGIERWHTIYRQQKIGDPVSVFTVLIGAGPWIGKYPQPTRLNN